MDFKEIKNIIESIPNTTAVEIVGIEPSHKCAAAELTIKFYINFGTLSRIKTKEELLEIVREFTEGHG